MGPVEVLLCVNFHMWGGPPPIGAGANTICLQSRAQGTLNYLASGQSISRERTLQRGEYHASDVVLQICLLGF